jgi:hypothetical protein
MVDEGCVNEQKVRISACWKEGCYESVKKKYKGN